MDRCLSVLASPPGLLTVSVLSCWKHGDNLPLKCPYAGTICHWNAHTLAVGLDLLGSCNTDAKVLLWSRTQTHQSYPRCFWGGLHSAEPEVLNFTGGLALLLCLFLMLCRCPGYSRLVFVYYTVISDRSSPVPHRAWLCCGVPIVAPRQWLAVSGVPHTFQDALGLTS